MAKFLGILLLILAGVIVGFIINFIIDGIVILFKKLGAKIRLALGLPVVVDAPKEEAAPEQEAPKEDAAKKSNNDILQKILAKRKNATSDVEHPDFVVEDFEVICDEITE